MFLTRSAICDQVGRPGLAMPHSGALLTYTLRLGDNALVLGHRLSEWCGHAPVLEEDLALANMALDLIGQARLLLSYAGQLEGCGRDEDALAYLRDAGDYRNVLLVEQPNRDFAATMVRQLFYATYAELQFAALAGSADPSLAAIAVRSAKELAYHVRHASEWIIRLGDGTGESHRRLQEALTELWPYTGELFELDEYDSELIAAGIAPDPTLLRPRWNAAISPVLERAKVEEPRGEWMQSGGRSGRHSEHLGHLLAELQFLPRAYPGATW